MSLLTSVVHSAPLLGSSSSQLDPEDLPPLPDTPTEETTVSSASLSARTTPLSHSTASSPMDVDHSTTTTVPPAAVNDDADDVFVEAPESQQPDYGDDVEMYDGEAVENEQTDRGALGDVNQLATFQTPDRKRAFEVDSKTITRPKKTSPLSVPLPEVFNQESNDQQEAAVPPPQPIAASTPKVMSATATAATPASSSSSSLSPRPTAAVAAAAAGTPTPAAAAPPPSGLGATITKSRPAPEQRQPAAATPAAPRPARQQTMVVSSALTKDLKAAIEAEKTASTLDEAAASRLEARIVALVQLKEQEWASKHDRLGQIMVAQKAEADTRARQAEADLEGLQAALDCVTAASEAGYPCSRCVGGAAPSSSSLPHLPPAPVLAAMSADKMAELARLKKEKEALESENNKLHQQYNSLYETYSQQRAVIPQLKTANEQLEHGVREHMARFEKLKRHAEAKLEGASGENDELRAELKRQADTHTDNTLTMRIRLKQRDAEIAELQESLTTKKRQVVELKEMCEQLIRQADANVSDIE